MSNLGALDMALDDVISQNRKRNTNRRSDNNNRGAINKRRSGARPSSSPYNNRPRRTTPNNNNNNRSNNAGRSLASNRNSENSLVVSNLHFNVTEKDLYDLFGQIGKLRRAFLHIGPNGKSAGIADVVFVNSNDAERARVTYNNVQLDGRPMRITVASIIASVPTSAPRTSSRFNNNNNNNGRRPMRGNARRENRSKPNQQDLDADMDSYMGVNNEDTQMN
ncbi:hypothetical protein CU098_011777 [Rhizopus stolonifer]|uniref:RRM domain-containing protein n=1 Tax=Rhizopus stolonifer TaxID=4846 RepID=A0A367KN51_RHIST|nr:hypothetical protein CU098_011777 [Rhizopus stolonifer]